MSVSQLSRAYVHVSKELFEEMTAGLRDLDVVQKVFLLAQLGLRVLAIESSVRHPRDYRLEIEGEGLPPESHIALEYERGEDGEPRLVRWR